MQRQDLISGWTFCVLLACSFGVFLGLWIVGCELWVDAVLTFLILLAGAVITDVIATWGNPRP